MLNLAGIMVAMGLLFFSLWQLDLIVSGPVWWSSGVHGTGSGWSHPSGAYSNDYFQCFLWKTTIGQAYDTLFMLIFISFIILFASAFFWPRSRGKDAILSLSKQHSASYGKGRNLRAKQRQRRGYVKPRPTTSLTVDPSTSMINSDPEPSNPPDMQP